DDRSGEPVGPRPDDDGALRHRLHCARPAGLRCPRMSTATVPDGRLRALLAGFATGDLRRVQTGWGLSSVGEWGFMVILSIYAFDRGGAAAVGLAGGLRLVPAAIAAPLASGFADRHSRRAVIVRCLLARALS